MSLISTRKIQLSGTMGYVRENCKDYDWSVPVTKVIFRNDREIVVDWEINGEPAFLKTTSDDGVRYKGLYEWGRGHDKEVGEVEFRLFTNPTGEYLFFGSCVDPTGYRWIWWMDFM